MTETKTICFSRDGKERVGDGDDGDDGDDEERFCDGKERVGDGDDGDDEERFCVSVVVEPRQKVNSLFLFFLILV